MMKYKLIPVAVEIKETSVALKALILKNTNKDASKMAGTT